MTAGEIEELTWIPIAPRLDFGVGLAQEISGPHPLTPQSVRDRYASENHGDRPVIWGEPASGLVGICSRRDEVTWRVMGGEQLHLHFRRPAKGSGFVMLDFAKGSFVAPERVAFAYKFNDEYKLWIDELAAALQQACGASLHVEDEGSDA